MNQRRSLVIANWKMHKTRAEAIAFLRAFKNTSQTLALLDLAIAPSFPLLEAVSRELEGSSIKLAAQNMHFAKEGAFTGEVSPYLLHDLAVTYVILGHSERREHFGETDEFIHEKLRAAFDFDLQPILCIGETLEERQRGEQETERVLERQLHAALQDVRPQHVERLVVAYEPIWAIGTGIHASPVDAEACAKFIRHAIARWYPSLRSASVRILYGGSVKPENASDLLRQPNIDGALVGGASLDPNALAAIALAAKHQFIAR